MAPISTMKTKTVHRIGILFRKSMWKLSCCTPPMTVCSGFGLLAARGQAKLISIAPP